MSNFQTMAQVKAANKAIGHTSKGYTDLELARMAVKIACGNSCGARGNRLYFLNPSEVKR